MKEIYTIGFSKKNLREFIYLLNKAKVTNLVDIRLNNTSQLAGYAKKDDLAYILELVGIRYTHNPLLAPDDDLLTDYKKGRADWAEYEKRYIDLLESRNTKEKIKDILGEGIPVFLCSEEKADRCHRRLLVEYINDHFDEDLRITHLG